MPKEPIVKCRLGSLQQIQVPVKFTTGRVDNTVTHQAAVFGNGAYCGTARRNRIVFDSGADILPHSGRYTISFWANFNFSMTNGVASSGTQLMFGLLEDGGVKNTWDFVSFQTTYSYWSTTVNGSTTQTRLDSPTGLTFSSGTWYHIAFVCDKDGIDGGSDVQRIYLDNSILWNSTAALSYDATDTIKTFVFGSYDDTSTSTSAGSNTYLDNMSLYDYAKTDFSDRFNERDGMNDDSFII
jgi:hypothetical protein